jgi:S1-C subfamily serine protease
LGLLGVVACAAPPAQQAVNTPAARIAKESLVSLQSNGVSVGAGVALDERRVITNAHVIRQAGGDLLLRPADGGDGVRARVLAVSPRMDLAILEVPAGFRRPAPVVAETPGRGAAVWALGPEGLGRSVAGGQVTRPDVEMRGFGIGFVAGVGALMGFSGGPVVDESGHLVGLTTALPNPGSATALAVVTGVDVVGFAQGSGRQVFVLGITEILAELARLDAVGQARPRSDAGG